MANVPSQSARLSAIGPSPKYVQPVHSETVVSFSIEVSTTPLVKELGSDLLVDVVPDKVLIFIIFMHEIHGISVPFSKGVPCSFSLIIIHDLNEF
jgi:hypothetical protein